MTGADHRWDYRGYDQMKEILQRFSRYSINPPKGLVRATDHRKKETFHRVAASVAGLYVHRMGEALELDNVCLANRLSETRTEKSAHQNCHFFLVPLFQT